MKKTHIFSGILASIMLIAGSSIITKEIQTKAATDNFAFGNPVSLDKFINKYGSAQKAFESITSQGKVIVDFYAEWCGPCKRLAPVLQNLASERSDILFLKVNVDHHREISGQYGVRGIPALLYFNNGNKSAQSTGFMSKKDLNAKFNQLY